MSTNPRSGARLAGEQGVALITALLVMALMSALMIGFTATVTSDQRYRTIDKDRVRAFYAAQSGLEKLSADLAGLFLINVSPSTGQIAALGDEDHEPDLDGITYTTSGEGDGYSVTPLPVPPGETGWDHITSGPYQGLIALKRAFDLDSSARTAGGGEVHLRRTVETVAIPVFQFGLFSDMDLSFHAGPNFTFGGRIHTNSNLYLAHGNGATLTLPEKVTAVGEVVRRRLVNGNSVTVSSHEGTIRMARAPGAFRNLAATEGSVVDGSTSAFNDPTWTNVSLSYYNGYLRNGRTGARRLNLPVVTVGGSNVNIIQRPAAGEDATNPALLGERFFSKVSVRVLLSDVANDITSLPGVTADAPVSLEGTNWNLAPPAGYGPVDATHPPIARSSGPVAVTPTIRNNHAAGTDILVRLNANVPAEYRHPAVLNVSVAGVPAGNLNCTGKRGTRFTGCTGLPNLNAGAVIAAAVPTVDGDVTVSTTVTANWAGPGNELEVVSTLPFAPSTFWVRNTDDNQNVLVTCRGYNDADFFRECNVSNQIDNNAQVLSQALTPAGTGRIGGFIKVEMQDTNNVWQDVTMEVLNHGIGAPNQPWRGTAGYTGNICPDPTPNAILRIQRLRDNVEPAAGTCSYAGSTNSADWWPQTLFDAREAIYRDTSPGANNIRLGGVMHYVALDVQNLSRWLQGAGPYAGGSGPSALSVNGYSVYFSDRRNNRTDTNRETGEYGFEDTVNPAVAGGASNNLLDGGEDVNLSGALDSYGDLPAYQGTRNSVAPGSVAPLDATARHTTNIQSGHARVNRALLFRRALKLVNGTSNIVTPGLTIVAENPVYVQGDWNAPGSFVETNVATAIISDSVTVLSNAWNDNVSYTSPYAPGSRPRAAQSWYRFAVIAGKNPPFAKASVTDVVPEDFGTDGGAHNFLRMLEGGAGTVNYRGSIATFYFARQATGIYKCCTTVYGAPTRSFAFDTNFLDPARLPPLTPVFRDLNALGFRQEIRPGF